MLMDSSLFMTCPQCGTDNSRASTTCMRCGCHLHGRSQVTGVCPGCHALVRATQISCLNCGRHLVPQIQPQRLAMTPQERRQHEKEKRAATGAFRLFLESMRQGAAWFRALGLLCLGGGAVKGCLAARGLQHTSIAGQAIDYTGEAVVALAVALVGLVLLVFSRIVDTPD